MSPNSSAKVWDPQIIFAYAADQNVLRLSTYLPPPHQQTAPWEQGPYLQLFFYQPLYFCARSVYRKVGGHYSLGKCSVPGTVLATGDAEGIRPEQDVFPQARGCSPLPYRLLRGAKEATYGNARVSYGGRANISAWLWVVLLLHIQGALLNNHLFMGHT